MKTSTARKLTYDDFLHFPDDGRRHELIDGVHYVTPSPVTIHQRLVARLHGALHVYLQEHPVGEAFLAPLDILLSPHDVVEPDLFVVMQEQADIVTEPNVVGPPAIVVEVLSPTTRRRDVGIKRKLFDRAGVGEYRLVDPAGRTVTVHRRWVDGALEANPPLADTDSLMSQRLPGFSLKVEALPLARTQSSRRGLYRRASRMRHLAHGRGAPQSMTTLAGLSASCRRGDAPWSSSAQLASKPPRASPWPASSSR